MLPMKNKQSKQQKTGIDLYKTKLCPMFPEVSIINLARENAQKVINAILLMGRLRFEKSRTSRRPNCVNYLQ